MAFNGIDVRATGDRIVLDALLADDTGSILTTGTTTLKLYRLLTDGALESYDFNDNTFKTTALTTETVNMTHRQGNNASTNTGIWTYALTTVTGLAASNLVYALTSNTGAFPVVQVRKLQFGGAEGDIVVSNARVNCDATAISASTAAADNLQGALTVATGIDINMEQVLPVAPTSDTTGDSLKTVSDVEALTTGFATTSPNRLIDHFRAVMSKVAATPTGVGTYDPATDSLEAEAENTTLIKGAGFVTSTDSLKAIRDYLELLIAPSIVASTNVSGSGFISDCIGLVRRAVDEPSTNPKYTNTDILEFIQAAFDVVMADVNINTDHPILVRYDLSIVPGTQSYTLPPGVSRVWRVAKINVATGLPDWEIWPSTEFSFHGRGFSLEGNTLRLLRDWQSSETLQILYVPNSEIYMHKATASSATATTIVFPTTVTDGTLDKRPNAYGGYTIRLISSTENIAEERIIRSYDLATRTATVDAWDTTPTGTIVYEAVPQFNRLMKHVVCLRAAMDILAQEGNSKRLQTLLTSYQVKMSALRRDLSTKNERFPHSMNGDTVDNQDRWQSFGGSGVL